MIYVIEAQVHIQNERERIRITKWCQSKWKLIPKLKQCTSSFSVMKWSILEIFGDWMNQMHTECFHFIRSMYTWISVHTFKNHVTIYIDCIGKIHFLAIAMWNRFCIPHACFYRRMQIDIQHTDKANQLPSKMSWRCTSPLL